MRRSSADRSFQHLKCVPRPVCVRSNEDTGRLTSLRQRHRKQLDPARTARIAAQPLHAAFESNRLCQSPTVPHPGICVRHPILDACQRRSIAHAYQRHTPGE